MDVLTGYCHLLRQQDVIGNAIAKREEQPPSLHLGRDSRESFHYADDRTPS
jgi:hypothetical protein